MTHESAQGSARKIGFHQRLANEECVETSGPETSDVFASFNAALGNTQDVLGNFRSQAIRGLKIDMECFQIATVHANDVAPGVQGALQFGFVVNFAKHIEAKLHCLAVKTGKFSISE